MAEPFSTVAQVKSYIFGGNATFTVKSLETGNHLTYKVKRIKGDKDRFLALRRVGETYMNLGVLSKEQVHMWPVAAIKTMVEHIPHFVALRWLLGLLRKDQLPSKALVFHEGSCGICGRPLTDPTSIQRGIGPDCWSKIGG